MHGIWLVAFAITAGFTASAIIANLYRIAGLRGETTGVRTFRNIVLIFAGPSVLFETAVKGFIQKSWHPVAFWLSAAVVLYWSLFLGLMVVAVGVRL